MNVFVLGGILAKSSHTYIYIYIYIYKMNCLLIYPLSMEYTNVTKGKCL